MEKHKTKKVKTLQIKYPVPYTQSWPNSERTKHKKATSRSAQKKHQPLPQRCWPCGRPAQRLPDPTVAHLKYGIFPKKPSVVRPPSKTVIGKSSKPSSPQEKRLNTNMNKKNSRPVQPSETPILVFRAIDKNLTRQLSMSETMHIDVKPRILIPLSQVPRTASPNSANVRRSTYGQY